MLSLPFNIGTRHSIYQDRPYNSGVSSSDREAKKCASRNGLDLADSTESWLAFTGVEAAERDIAETIEEIFVERCGECLPCLRRRIILQQLPKCLLLAAGTG